VQSLVDEAFVTTTRLLRRYTRRLKLTAPSNGRFKKSLRYPPRIGIDEPVSRFRHRDTDIIKIDHRRAAFLEEKKVEMQSEAHSEGFSNQLIFL
jgi:hypothetical protein